MPADQHRQLRELLGAYALDALDPPAVAAVQAHLDGCAGCRAELAEITPVVSELRRVDLSRVASPTTPPADLGERIRERVAHERVLVDAAAARDRRRDAGVRTRRRLLSAAAGLAVVLAALGVGSLLGRASAPAVVAGPAPSASVKIPLESVPVRAAAGLGVDRGAASVIAHTWGVEAKIVATGFTPGQTYRAAFRSADGRLLPAGEFLGTGDKPLTCNLQAALLRPDTAGFLVMDAGGAVVLTADLPVRS